MRRIRLSGVLALVVMVSGIVTASALAGGTTATQFSALYYQNDITQLWNCSGVRLAQKNATKDTETCIATGTGTNAYVAGTYKNTYTTSDGCARIANVPGIGTDRRWVSDYELFVNPGGVLRCSIDWKISFAPNGDGSWTVSILAYY